MRVGRTREVSTELANKLMRAKSAGTFLRTQGTAFGWQSMAALKGEVDRLVGHDLNAAGRLASRIEQVATLTRSPVFRAFARASLARVAHFSGQHTNANTLYRTSANALRAAKLPVEAAVIETQQIDVLILLGRFKEALRLARSARRGLGHRPVDVARLETNVGNIYYQLDRYGPALGHYDRADKILARRGNEAMRALVHFNRSNVLAEMDRSSQALALLHRAVAAFDGAGQQLKAAQTRYHIAYLEFLRGNYNQALHGYYEARDVLARLGATELVAWCNLELAEILLSLNSFEDAQESAGSAAKAFREFRMPYETAKASVTRGLARLGLGQLTEARTDLTTSRRLYVRNGNATFTAAADAYLAEVALRDGDAARALKLASSSVRAFSRLKLKTKSAQSSVIVARALYQRGEFNGARRRALEALRSLGRSFAPGAAYQSHHLLGRIDRALGNGKRALSSFRKAVAHVERMRGGIAADEFKATFLTDKIEVYEDAIAACLDDGTDRLVEEAFRLVESSKSRALADLLARYVRDADRSPRLKSGIRAKLSKLIEDLNWYSSKAIMEDEKDGQRNAGIARHYRSAMADCEKQIERLFRRLEAQESTFSDIRRMPPTGTTVLRRTLEPEEIAIEYFTTGDSVSAFVASRDRVDVVRGFASRKEVEHLLSAARFQVDKFNYGSEYAQTHVGQMKRAMDDHLSKLYQLVFGPLEALIEGGRLIIIPHGAMHYVPFHALRDRGQYLVDQFEISYAPSASVLSICRQGGASLRRKARSSARQNGTGSMLVLGVAERETPSIRDEIRAVKGLFPSAVAFSGAEATRENLIRFAPRARYVHLASHGYFRRDNPMFSFLKLADCQLNFYNLLDLELQADVVTLSACHTGVNMVFPGDELHGLMRGFLYAGARAMVVSLWAVNDKSTTYFMTEMYSQLRDGKPKRTALRNAQLATKDEYGHPYYWAPFILMGDPA